MLRDPYKREIYDNYGEEALIERTIAPNENIIHEEAELPELKADPIYYELDVTLEDLYSCKEHSVSFTRLKVCSECRGNASTI